MFQENAVTKDISAIQRNKEENEYWIDIEVPKRNMKRNKYIRKKFHREKRYICCYSPIGNSQKLSGGYCCTYPQTYRRRDITVENRHIARFMNDEIYVE